jgi:Zn-dependent protease
MATTNLPLVTLGTTVGVLGGAGPPPPLSSPPCWPGDHAVAARRYGVGGGHRPLILGGVARPSDEAPTPGVEAIVAAGPLVSVGLTVGLGAVAFALHNAGAPSLITASCAWLAVVNGVLAIFNLLPAAPLDGGRILAAIVWRHTGDRLRAVDRASQAGQFLGWLMTAAGAIWFLRAAARS